VECADWRRPQQVAGYRLEPSRQATGDETGELRRGVAAYRRYSGCLDLRTTSSEEVGPDRLFSMGSTVPYTALS